MSVEGRQRQSQGLPQPPVVADERPQAGLLLFRVRSQDYRHGPLPADLRGRHEEIGQIGKRIPAAGQCRFDRSQFRRRPIQRNVGQDADGGQYRPGARPVRVHQETPRCELLQTVAVGRSFRRIPHARRELLHRTGGQSRQTDGLESQQRIGRALRHFGAAFGRRQRHFHHRQRTLPQKLFRIFHPGADPNAPAGRTSPRRDRCPAGTIRLSAGCNQSGIRPFRFETAGAGRAQRVVVPAGRDLPARDGHPGSIRTARLLGRNLGHPGIA